MMDNQPGSDAVTSSPSARASVGHVEVTEADILSRLTEWTAGDAVEAHRWYHSVPIPAFGNKTAKQVYAIGLGERLDQYVGGLLAGDFA